jgi:protein-tyrosine phosphatase
VIDIHSHVLPKLDDGATDFDFSLEMLRIAERDGITCIIATPHSRVRDMTIDLQSIVDGVKRLNQIAEENNMNVKVFAGTEWDIVLGIPKMISNGFGCSLAASRYLLIEYSPWQDIAFYQEQFFEIMAAGYVPILAHPERYASLLRHPNDLYRFVQKGGLFQVNAASVTGLEGPRMRKFVFSLMRHGLVHFVASDAHDTGKRAPVLKKAYIKVSRRFGKDYADKLFRLNGKCVLNDERIIVPEPIRFRRPLFRFIIKRGRVLR